MLRNLLLTNLRVLVRNKAYALINIAGLALGLGSSLVVFLLVRHDLSYDSFQQNLDRIYRVNLVYLNTDLRNPGTPFPVAPALATDFPEFERVVQTLYEWEGLVTVVKENGTPDRFLEDTGIAFVNSAFLDVFYHDWLAGDESTALENPGSVVLTQSLAEKYFGGASPIGQRLTLNNKLDLHVTGVIADLPPNTNLPFKLLIAYDSLTGYQMMYDSQSWTQVLSANQTYVLLRPDVTPEQVTVRFPEFVTKYAGERVAKQDNYALQPLREIHFDTRIGTNFADRVVGMGTLLALILVGTLLIVTACINFVNLATAQAVKRAKEMGIRKVVGGSRTQLVVQFLVETAIITFCAAVLGLVLAEFFLRNLPDFISQNGRLSLHLDLEGFLVAATAALFVVPFAGFYPAVILSGFNPVQVLKQKLTNRQPGIISLRKALVVGQFTISQALIICTLIIGDQLAYFQSKPLGFQRNTIVTVPLPQSDINQLDIFRAQLQQEPNILNVTCAIGAPTAENNVGTSFTYKDFVGENKPDVDVKYVDENYIKTYGLNLLAGRDVARMDSANYVVVNQALISKMGITDPQEAIGKYIRYSRTDAVIVGVVEDFHTKSLHDGIGACLLAYRPDRFWQAGIKIAPQEIQSTLKHIEAVWSATFPDDLFSYEFLDDTIRSFYEEETRVAGLIQLFSAIAIAIGCLGLYGLVSFMVNQKTKEIGIRKVLSASVPSIILLFAREFAKLLLIAFAVAAPVAYLFMNSWLENYVYRIDIGPAVFVAGAAITLAVAGLTIGYKAVKAALANPIEALRYE